MFDSNQRGAASALDKLCLPGRVTLGLLLPADNDWARNRTTANGMSMSMPELAASSRQLRLADELGFRAGWLRDVPTFEREHGDPGQVFDPWTYLGYLAAMTRRMILGTAAVVAPLDHDLHIAKRAASVDVLSGGRFVLGLATGDRTHEYQLFGADYEARGERLRKSVGQLRALWEGGAGQYELAPRPQQGRLPLVIVGRAQQALDWIAAHGDAWFSYADSVEKLALIAAMWRQAQEAMGCAGKPLLMPLRLILEQNRNAKLSHFPMGVRTGMGELKRYLDQLHGAGIAHVALNLRLSERPVEQVLNDIGREPGLL